MKYVQDAGAVDLLTMTDAQIRVLDRMDSEMGYPLRDIAADTGVSERECRLIVRQFHALDAAGYGPLYSEDDNRLCGRGYWLNGAGSRAQRLLRKLVAPKALWAMRDIPSAQVQS